MSTNVIMTTQIPWNLRSRANFFSVIEFGLLHIRNELSWQSITTIVSDFLGENCKNIYYLCGYLWKLAQDLARVKHSQLVIAFLLETNRKYLTMTWRKISVTFINISFCVYYFLKNAYVTFCLLDLTFIHFTRTKYCIKAIVLQEKFK